MCIFCDGFTRSRGFIVFVNNGSPLTTPLLVKWAILRFLLSGEGKIHAAILRFLEGYKIDQRLKPLTSTVFFLKLRTRSSGCCLRARIRHARWSRETAVATCTTFATPMTVSPPVGVIPLRAEKESEKVSNCEQSHHCGNGTLASASTL